MNNKFEHLKTKKGISPNNNVTFWLQGEGDTCGIKAKDLQPGDEIVWNFGYTSEVKGIEFSKTGKTLTTTTISEGKEYKRKFNANRILAVKFGGKVIGTNRTKDLALFSQRVRKIVDA